jgi:hypothetical protein
MVGELRRIYSLTRAVNATFSLTAIPPGIQKSSEGMSFDRTLMRRLFDEGHRSAMDGSCWQSALPSALSADDYPHPRGGVHFEVNESPPIKAPPDSK